jgi:hypothetical protein
MCQRVLKLPPSRSLPRRRAAERSEGPARLLLSVRAGRSLRSPARTGGGNDVAWARRKISVGGRS